MTREILEQDPHLARECLQAGHEITPEYAERIFDWCRDDKPLQKVLLPLLATATTDPDTLTVLAGTRYSTDAATSNPACPQSGHVAAALLNIGKPSPVVPTPA